MKAVAVFVAIFCQILNATNFDEIFADFREDPGAEKKIYTLQDLLKRAAKNPKITLAKYREDDAQIAVYTAIARFLPDVNASYELSHNHQKISTKNMRNLPAQERFSQNFSISATANIFNGFSDFYALKEARANAEAAYFAKNSEKDALYLAIISAYFSYFDEHANFLSLERKQKQLEDHIARLKNLVQQELSTRENLQILEARNAGILARKKGVELKKLQLKMQISRMISEENFTLAYSKIPNFPKTDVKPAQNNDILALQNRAMAAQNAYEKANYLPVVNVFASASFGTQKPKNASVQDLVSVSVGLRVGIKITDNIIINLQKQHLKIAEMTAQIELNERKNDLKNALFLQKKSLEIADEKIAAAMLNYEAQSARFASVEKKFAANLTDTTAFYEALSENFDALKDVYTAANEKQREAANFAVKSGQNLDEILGLK